MWPSQMLEVATKMNPFVTPYSIAKCQPQGENTQSLIPGRNIGAFSVAEGGKLRHFLTILCQPFFFFILIPLFIHIPTIDYFITN